MYLKKKNTNKNFKWPHFGRKMVIQILKAREKKEKKNKKNLKQFSIIQVLLFCGQKQILRKAAFVYFNFHIKPTKFRTNKITENEKLVKANPQKYNSAGILLSQTFS